MLEEERIRLFVDFDPVHDPEGCLRRYNAVALALANLLDPAKREVAQARLASAEPLLRDFIADQAAAASMVVGDCETTELIEHGTAIGDMTISVASLLFVEDNGGEFMLPSGETLRSAGAHHCASSDTRSILQGGSSSITLSSTSRWRQVATRP